jgi:hypothetical protein
MRVKQGGYEDIPGVLKMWKIFFAAAVLAILFPGPAGFAGTIYVDGSVVASGDGSSWETAFKRIQSGIDAASDEDTVIVAEGTYRENVSFNGKNILLRSTDPLNAAVVGNTTMMAPKGGGSVVAFAGTEDARCVLTGFTVRGGDTSRGGGVCGGTEQSHSHATIQNNRIESNIANNGAGIAYCDGIISDNTISENHGYIGGGLCQCHGVIERNTIIGNIANYMGGGVWDCDTLIRNNTIAENKGDQGAGLAECDGTIENNIIARNGGSFMGGGFLGGGLGNCNGTIRNNIITGNAAYEMGGGLIGCNGAILSNLIAGNQAQFGCGIFGAQGSLLNNTIVSNRALHESSAALQMCTGTIQNCIIWGNMDAQIEESSVPTNSCIQGWGSGGSNTGLDPLIRAPGYWDDNGTPGNIEDDVWVDGDYHLMEGSPCIDSGSNIGLTPPGLDLDGNLRIAWGGTATTVDMGAYEYNSQALAITGITLTGGGSMILTWRSQPNDMYIVRFCSGLPAGLWQDEAGDLASEGDATSWTILLPIADVRFYRVEMMP